MLIGYARVSTQDQNPALQLDALEKAGCKTTFEDKLSGSRGERPGLLQALTALREGDTLAVFTQTPEKVKLAQGRLILLF